MTLSSPSLLTQYQHKIDEAKIVSFDIFDTLLLRPYKRPTDLFKHLEQIERKPNFSHARQRAETAARKNHAHQEDITLDQIYDEIDDIYKPMKDSELGLEYQVLQANPEMQQVYEYAQQQKKPIIILSDMYLPTAFIKEVLKKNGFTRYAKLYVSGDIGKTKSTGTLYRQALDDLGVAPADIVHIGDNKSADVKRAQELGLNAIYYRQVISQFTRNNRRGYRFSKQIDTDLGGSILLALMAWRWHKIKLGLLKPDYWSDIGYQYAGPVAYGYCRFVEKKVYQQNLAQLLFIARDGYTLQKVFHIINPSIKTHYIYAPRLLNLICRLDYNPDAKDQAKTIVDYYSQQNDIIKQQAESGVLTAHEIIIKNKALFTSLAKVESQKYEHYLLHKIKQPESIGIVDTITGEFSSQRIVQHFLSTTVHGMYWGVIKSANTIAYDYSAYIHPEKATVDDNRYFTSNWNFIEFLITSPEYPIKNITAKGQPIYDPDPNQSEIDRAAQYPVISQGAVQFAEDVKRIFNQWPTTVSAEMVVKWVNCYIDLPEPEDIAQMNGIQFGIDSTHKVLVPLFTQKISWQTAFLHPYKSLQILKKMTWRTLPQLLWLCIFFSDQNRTTRFKKNRIVFIS